MGRKPISKQLERMEFRRAVRYPVELRCMVSQFAGNPIHLPGRTVNMSRCGVLVAFDQGIGWEAPKVGDTAKVAVRLSPQTRKLRECWVDCQCYVARVGEQSEAPLVAFDLRRYEFHSRAPN